MSVGSRECTSATVLTVGIIVSTCAVSEEEEVTTYDRPSPLDERPLVQKCCFHGVAGVVLLRHANPCRRADRITTKASDLPDSTKGGWPLAMQCWQQLSVYHIRPLCQQQQEADQLLYYGGEA